LVTGASVTENGAEHAALWFGGRKLDIGATGLGGPNNMAFGLNNFGEAVGAAQTSDPEPEDFCGFNALGFPVSNTSCLPFFWRNGIMHQLPTVGGRNGAANMIHGRGEIVGLAETTLHDPGCPVQQFLPVVWKNGQPHKLSTYGGDLYGVAAWINDKGQVVGSSGACAPFNPNSLLYFSQDHALLWQPDGTVRDLHNLGGTGANAGNHACAINNHTQVVGHSEVTGDVAFHAFLWTEQTDIQDLGTLTGDWSSLALGINDDGSVVGASLDANFNPRAWVLRNGSMVDLNTVASGRAGLYLLVAESINNRGEIIGLGVTNAGEAHGFLAIPDQRNHDDEATGVGGPASIARPMLSDQARQAFRQQMALRGHVRLAQ
jgi:probable HAF family extracellular repeat protein